MKTLPISIPVEEKTSKPLNETQRILIKARELLGPNGENWGKGQFCTKTDSGDAYCAWGSLLYCGNKDEELGLKAYRALADALGGDYIPSFNDNPDTTFTDISNLFDRAIQLAGEADG